MKGIIWLLLKSRWKFSICFQCDRFVRRTAIKKKEKERINAFIWLINEWTYISFGIIFYPMSKAFLKLRSSKIIRFSEQTMSMAKYPRIISRQTEANVHLYELPRKKCIVVRNVISSPFPQQRMDVVHSASPVHACHTCFYSVMTLASLSLRLRWSGTTLLPCCCHMLHCPYRRYSSCQRCPELCSLHTLFCNMAKTELKKVCACPRLTCRSIATVYIY